MKNYETQPLTIPLTNWLVIEKWFTKNDHFDQISHTFTRSGNLRDNAIDCIPVSTIQFPAYRVSK